MTRFLSVVMLLPAIVIAGDYTLEPLTNATGGLSGASADYSLTSSTTPGGHGNSADYTVRTGYAGQLGAPMRLSISAPTLTLAETGTSQLAAELLYDDGSSSPLTDTRWSVQSGPIASISATGLATPAVVYQNTQAVVRGSSNQFSDDLALTVLDTLPDNFATYATDGLPDLWQIQYFGLNAPKAGKYDDFDGDEIGNFIEYASGTDPSSLATGPQPLTYSGNTLFAPGSPLVDFSPAPGVLPYRVLFVRRKNPVVTLNYSPQFSRNLASWSNATTPVTVLADDGTFELLSVRFPVLIGGLRSSSKFFRLQFTP
jgi:hypothetical protein